MEALSAAQDDSSGANPSSVKSDDSSPRPDSRTGSPPPNCAICLGTCKNKSFTDSCLHQFCFSCLLTWSKVKAECPLCKQAFRSIIHNVRSNHQYEEYLVVQRQTEESSSRVEIDMDRVTAAAHRFRYRTTLTLPRRETIAIQTLLRHYPFMADVFPATGGRAPPARRRRSPSSFRRTVYRHNLWARPLPDFTGRFRDCSPEFYRYNDTQMHRLVPWINRELHYLLNENVGHISYVMSRILDLLPQHHINSTEFREALQRYFGDRTEHFLHELYCFASTPYDMTGYDRNVQYTTDSRISTMVNEVISSSESEASGDSDIVMVSSSEPAEPPPGPSRFPVPAYPQSYISQPATNSVIPIETISQSDTDDDSSEVMVVGYIKPPQERTPEIVDLLGSDSDVIVQDIPQPEPIPVPESQESRPVPSVKLTLKRHRSSEGPGDAASESDSDDSTYRPPPSRRRRRPHRATHSAHSASTSDTCRTTPDTCRTTPDTCRTSPDTCRTSSDTCRTSSDICRTSTDTCRTSPAPPRSPGPALARDADRDSHNTRTTTTTTTSEHSLTTSSSSSSSSSSPVSSPITSSSDSDYTDDSADEYSNLAIKKRSKKNSTISRDRKRSKKKSSRSRRKDKKSVKISEKDKRSKRKSHSGKGVKSSNKTSNSEWSVIHPEQTALDQPSTSGTGGTSSRDRRKANKERKRRRRDSRESRRLRSVVNVMYNNQKHTDESNSSHSHLSNATGTNNKSDTESTPSTSDTRTNKTETSNSHSELPMTSRGHQHFSSDSEDNLPLNLTLQKISPSFSL